MVLTRLYPRLVANKLGIAAIVQAFGSLGDHRIRRIRLLSFMLLVNFDGGCVRPTTANIGCRSGIDFLAVFAQLLESHINGLVRSRLGLGLLLVPMRPFGTSL